MHVPGGKPIKGRSMRGWKGAGALLAAALLAGPGGGGADGGTALKTFKLPDAAAVDTLNRMGADLAESVRPGPDGSVYVDAVVSPSEEAQFEALGYRAVGTIQDQADYDAVR